MKDAGTFQGFFQNFQKSTPVLYRSPLPSLGILHSTFCVIALPSETEINADVNTTKILHCHLLHDKLTLPRSSTDEDFTSAGRVWSK